MNNKFIIITLLIAVLSFIAGFIVANSLNRREQLRSGSETAAQTTSGNGIVPADSADATLTDDEINRRIAEADQNLDNYEFQKNLGSALYRYSAMKRDVRLLGEAARLMERANRIGPKDFDLLVALGNAYLDLGYASGENEKFVRSRGFYAAALQIRSTDAEVRTDYGLTFFLTEPREPAAAIAEFEKSLKLDPNHTKTLQAMAEALIATGKPAEAGDYVDRLQAADPANSAIPGLRSKLTAETPAERVK